MKLIWLSAARRNGESHAEIGRRYRQTEETAGDWLRTALQRIQTHFNYRAASTSGFAKDQSTSAALSRLPPAGDLRTCRDKPISIGELT